MYKKIIFGSIALLFVAASVFNIGLIQTRDAGDISLDAIAIMAQAVGEGNIAYGWTHNENKICNLPYGVCIVSDKDPSRAGYR